MDKREDFVPGSLVQDHPPAERTLQKPPSPSRGLGGHAELAEEKQQLELGREVATPLRLEPAQRSRSRGVTIVSSIRSSIMSSHSSWGWNLTSNTGTWAVMARYRSTSLRRGAGPFKLKQ